MSVTKIENILIAKRPSHSAAIVVLLTHQRLANQPLAIILAIIIIIVVLRFVTCMGVGGCDPTALRWSPKRGRIFAGQSSQARPARR